MSKVSRCHDGCFGSGRCIGDEREDVISALVDLGEDAEELALMTDEELDARVNDLQDGTIHIQHVKRFSLPRAFGLWFRAQTQGDRTVGATILFDMARNGSRDSLVWDLLRQTGAKSYTPETFAEAADLALKETA